MEGAFFESVVLQVKLNDSWWPGDQLRNLNLPGQGGASEFTTLHRADCIVLRTPEVGSHFLILLIPFKYALTCKYVTFAHIKSKYYFVRKIRGLGAIEKIGNICKVAFSFNQSLTEPCYSTWNTIKFTKFKLFDPLSSLFMKPMELTTVSFVLVFSLIINYSTIIQSQLSE